MMRTRPAAPPPGGPRPDPAPSASISPTWRARTADLAARITLVVGVLDVVAAVAPPLWRPFRPLTGALPGALTSAANAAMLVTGSLLIYLASGLRRRKRRAWRLAVVLLLADTVLHVVHGPDFDLMLVSALMLVALVVSGDEFRAAGDPSTRWRALGALVVGGLSATAVGLLFVTVRGGADVRGVPLPDRLWYVTQGLAGVVTPLTAGSGGRPDLMYDALLALGATVAVVVAYLFLRPPSRLPQLTEADVVQMRELLERHGRRDSLGYFALRDDKSVVWSESRKSCIAYRVVSGVMLASGDPLGDVEAWPGAIDAFLAEARTHAWLPAVVGCSETGAQVWRREAGMEALELGDEAVVDVDRFALDGRAMRNVRQMVSRVRRAGWQVRIHRMSDLADGDVAQLADCARRWRDGDVERGFSMALGRLGGPGDGRCVVVVAERDGVPRALLHLVPWGAEGLSLDLMRRDPRADAGLNELMLVELFERAGELGVRRVSLNFAVFRSALERGERIGASPVTRAWASVLLFASRWTQIESLYRFNNKFQPLWEPRYWCAPRFAGFARVSVAYAEAEAFLVRPRLGFWRR